MADLKAWSHGVRKANCPKCKITCFANELSDARPLNYCTHYATELANVTYKKSDFINLKFYNQICHLKD